MIQTKTHSFESDYCVATPHFPFMYIRILKANISDIVSVFTDPAETNCITFGKEKYDGYTRFVSVSVEDDAYKICLERG